MTVSKSQKKLVHERADYCCEYCRSSSITGGAPFHVDHIIPRKHNGTDDTDNLCLACYQCNAFKSHDLTGFDPLTEKITPLYHPRNQIWENHFSIKENMELEGLTDIGRTSVRVLKMNQQDRVESRQVLAELGDYPCNSN